MRSPGDGPSETSAGLNEQMTDAQLISETLHVAKGASNPIQNGFDKSNHINNLADGHEDESLLSPGFPPSLGSSRSASSGSTSSSEVDITINRRTIRRSRSFPDKHIGNTESDTSTYREERGSPQLQPFSITCEENNVSARSLVRESSVAPGADVVPQVQPPSNLKQSHSLPELRKLASRANSDVIKEVRKPTFPIRLFDGTPPPFSPDSQKSKMRWRYARFSSELEPECIVEPVLEEIREMVLPYIRMIVPTTVALTVTFLAEGGFNWVYTVSAIDNQAQNLKDFVVRVALPIYPYYKVESDVATTEFVRYSTSIPVPVIYAFDSCANNQLGFEWMLMEKIDSKPLYKVWDDTRYEVKEDLVRQIAGWTHELSTLRFGKLGSIYMRDQGTALQFFIGPLIHFRLFEGDHLFHEVDRGPFNSLQSFYDVVLDLTQRFTNDPKHEARLVRCVGATMEESWTKRDEAIRNERLRIELQCSIYAQAARAQSQRQALENTILAQADADDYENEFSWGIDRSLLSWLPHDLDVYRYTLSMMCPVPPVSQPMTTMLVHPDISMANVFVDDAGSPVCLIDWERVRLEPATLIEPIPEFLRDERDAYYEPDGLMSCGGSNVYSEEYLEKLRGKDEEAHLQILRRIENTKLRITYREVLKRLRSPLCEALDKDHDSLEIQLAERVICPHYAPPGALQWVIQHIGDAWLDDTDDEGGEEVELD